ncbi:HAMP domain-containing histidine kinase [Pacificimonas sp. WHA3]|uniref:HAMP domain-containing histidine kinase n=1 Tax=Pacificimonas pallii TaxID=2827236 RepID=A0ABS6SG76_9SPHN|nr:HAMP domain-containing sensor histidine kinase [Pacificimonas pallii]MBV7257414.1 HAMP domain-containing histidine kinase [Pacificimonas pallii]
MNFRLRTALYATLLIFTGAAAMLAWREGFYANTALALLVAVWISAILSAMATRQTAPVTVVMQTPDEAALREQKRLIAYLNLSPAPLVTLDREMRLWAVNRAARRLFAADDLIPSPPDGLVAAISATAPGQTTSVRMDGGHAAALAIADLDSGGTGGRIAALIDIDAELKVAEANALRDLLQVLSHEIMNALTPIASLGRTAAALMMDVKPDIAAARDAVETIARRADGLQKFSRAYRDLARLPPPDISPIELRIFVSDLQRMFDTRWTNGPNLTVKYDRAPQLVLADPDQLNAAVWALLQNAVEAGGSGVHVTLEIQRLANALTLSVIDDGPGLSDAHRDRVFQPFYTTRPEGSGIGLTLARQIARAHGGDLQLVHTQPAHGARFELTFPAVR